VNSKPHAASLTRRLFVGRVERDAQRVAHALDADALPETRRASSVGGIVLPSTSSAHSVTRRRKPEPCSACLSAPRAYCQSATLLISMLRMMP
jgi:hypothetical protein